MTWKQKVQIQKNMSNRNCKLIEAEKKKHKPLFTEGMRLSV